MSSYKYYIIMKKYIIISFWIFSIFILIWCLLIRILSTLWSLFTMGIYTDISMFFWEEMLPNIVDLFAYCVLLRLCFKKIRNKNLYK